MKATTEEYATKRDLNFFEERIDKRFDDLTALMSQFANDVNDRFEAVDRRFDKVERRLDAHDEEFRKLNKKYDRLLDTISLKLEY